MTPEQADKIIELLSESIELQKKQIALFEQYDAQSIFEEEEVREELLRERSRRSIGR